MRKRTEIGLLVIALLAVVAGVLGAGQSAPVTQTAADLDPTTITVPIDGRDQRVEILPREDGSMRVRVQTAEGMRELTGDQFVSLMYGQQQAKKRHWFFRVLNITSWRGFFWVSVGLLGQLLFTFRMVLQWLASEKHGKSVVPVGFWWGSLIGGLMLLTYFIWRKDIVGILGQSTGAFIYARNLVLIYRERGAAATEVEIEGSPR
jgi:lipid-A-disaccharide synthase-like uncharacterized protein